LQSDEPASKVCAEVIHHGHDQIEGEKQREEAVLEEETDGNLDLLAQAAGPDIPQDDRLPDVDLPGVEDASDILRQDTRSRLSLMQTETIAPQQVT
jgi:NADPH-dependent glutamate synthase beta subunit-like oxidoreductase